MLQIDKTTSTEFHFGTASLYWGRLKGYHIQFKGSGIKICPKNNADGEKNVASQSHHIVPKCTHWWWRTRTGTDRQMVRDRPSLVCLFVFSRVFKLTLITAMYLKHDTSNVYEQGRSGGYWDGI